MSYSKEDRKKVFDFWVRILEPLNNPVYYENIRGYITQAPLVVKKYVLHKCKGELLLEYFQRRKNYFIVEKGYVTLKNTFQISDKDDYLSDHENIEIDTRTRNKSKTQEKSRSRQHSKNAPNPFETKLQSESLLTDNEQEEYEDIAIKYFTELLKRNKRIEVNLIELSNLNKKIQRLINKYYRKKIRSFFLSFPAFFCIDEEDYVHLRFPEKETFPDEKENLKSNETKPNETESVNIDPDVKHALNYHSSLQFFIDILQQKSSSSPVDKLSGYLSQASKEIRDYIKYNYRNFSDFFKDVPQIFLVDRLSVVTLAPNYKKKLKKMKKLINKAITNSLNVSSEMSLKSCIDYLLKKESQQDTFSVADNSITTETFAYKSACIQGMSEKGSFTDVKHLHDNFYNTSSEMVKESVTDFKQSDEKICDILDDQDEAADKSDEVDSVQIYENLENKLLEFIFCVEMYCVNIVECEYWFPDQLEIKTLKYFTNIMEKCKVNNLTNLQGYLGSAPDEIRSFVNKHYKKEKFKNFFLKNFNLFTLKSIVVTLTPNYDKIMAEIETNTLEVARCDKIIIESIYEDSYFEELKTELFAYLYEVVNYLRFKDKAKLSRITEIRLRFPHCNECIRLMEGDSLMIKTATFLNMFNIFEFPSADYIAFHYKDHSNLLLPWLEEASCSYQMSHVVATPYYLFKQKFSDTKPFPEYEETCKELSQECIEVINRVAKDNLKSQPFIQYHVLPIYLPKNILKEINECNKDSSAILLSLINKDLILKKGQIKLNIPTSDILKEETDSSSNCQSFNSQIGFENLEIKDESEISNIKDFVESSSDCKDTCEKSVTKNINKLYNSSTGDSHFVTLKVEKPVITKMRDLDTSAIESVDEHITSLSENVKASDYSNFDHIKQNTSKDCAIYFSDELIDLLNQFKKPNDSFKEDALCGNLHSQNNNSHEKVTMDSSAQVNFEPANEKEINLEHITPIENNSELILPSDENKDKFESNSDTSIAPFGRQKSDSGYEELDFIDSEKICHDIKNSSSCSSYEEYKEEFLENSKENNSDDSISDSETNEKDIQMTGSLPDYQDMEFETDSDSDSCVGDCGGINMYLKECIETPECSAPIVLCNRETFFNDCNLAELLSHDDSTHLNVYSNINIVRSEDHSSKINKCLQPPLEGDIIKNTDFNFSGISNIEIMKDLNLKPEFSAKKVENDEASTIEIYNNNVPFDSESKLKTNNASSTEICKKDTPFYTECKKDVMKSTNLNLLKTLNRESVSDTNLKQESLTETAENKAESLAEICNKDIQFCFKINSGNEVHPLIEKTLPNNDLNASVDEILPNVNDTCRQEFPPENVDIRKESSTTEICKNYTPFYAKDKSDTIKDIDFSLLETSNVKPILDTNLKQNFSIKNMENDAFSMEICNKSTPFYSKSKSKTEGPAITEKSALRKNLDIFTDEMPLNDNCKKNKEKASEMKSSINYPLQPLTAEVVLLTTSSCIAVTKIDSRMQSIYFLKSVYFCEKHEYCSTCFDSLAIGDKVSCFVPLTEISQKTWIAFMVSKEKSLELDRMKSVNEILIEQMHVDRCRSSLDKSKYPSQISTDDSVRYNSSDTEMELACYNHVNTTTMPSESETKDCNPKWEIDSQFSYQRQDTKQTKNLTNELNDAFLSSCYNCNKKKIDATCSVSPDVQHRSSETNYSCSNVKSQTLLSGSVKEHPNTDEVASQTFSSFISSQHASVQAESQMTECYSQTDSYLKSEASKEAQTDFTDIQRIERCCQTELSGEVKSAVKTVSAVAQSISTGAIMITDYYHF